MEENEILETLDYEAIVEKRSDELTELLDGRDMKQLQRRMEELNDFDVAEFLAGIEDNRMPMVFRLLSKEHGAEVFANLDVPDQERIINSITDSELAAIIEELYVDDAVDMMEELPANVVKRIMRTATSETRSLINQYLRYPENSAGTIMTSEFVDLKKYMSVRESFARIRRIGKDRETIYVCFVISADRKLEGVVTVKDLLLADDDDIIEDLMNRNVVFATTTEDRESVSEKFSDYDLMAMPVVDREGRLVGLVTVDDIIDVMEQEVTEDFEIMAGMMPSDKPYSRTGIFEMWKNRIPWLMFLMLSATFTSMILTSFEDMLAVQAGLVAFIPMLMGTGGNSGSQSSVTVIRGLSLGELDFSDIFTILWKEIRTALMCGIALAVVCFAKIWLVDHLMLGNENITLMVDLVVCCALCVTVVLAKVVGCMLPIAAKAVKLDPAVMASPFISTIVDALSLLVYFMFAKMLLKI